MKTPKLITALISILLFSNLLLAANLDKNATTNIATHMVENLCKYVDINENQKTIIQAKADTFELRYISSNEELDNEIRCMLMNQALIEYKLVLDSVLTQSQKDTLMTRQIREIKKDARKL